MIEQGKMNETNRERLAIVKARIAELEDGEYDYGLCIDTRATPTGKDRGDKRQRKEPVHRQRSKHIGMKFMNVRGALLAGEVKLVAVATERQVADMFTKSLDRGTFLRLRDTLMGAVPFTEMARKDQETAKASKAEKAAIVLVLLWHERAGTLHMLYPALCAPSRG